MKWVTTILEFIPTIFKWFSRNKPVNKADSRVRRRMEEIRLAQERANQAFHKRNGQGR